MKTYGVEVIETYKYRIDVKADNEKEALKRAKFCYENYEEAGLDGIFTADANSYEKTRFKIVKDK